MRSRLTLSKPARARLAEGGARAVGAVQARQAAQFVVAKRLDAEAQAVDARVAIRRKPRLGDRFGVRFERDLAIGGDVERRSRRRDDARDLLRLEERRRPAAEVDRVSAAAARRTRLWAPARAISSTSASTYRALQTPRRTGRG